MHFGLSSLNVYLIALIGTSLPSGSLKNSKTPWKESYLWFWPIKDTIDDIYDI